MSALLVGRGRTARPDGPVLVKDWAYFPFAITFVSAVVAHFAVGMGDWGGVG